MRHQLWISTTLVVAAGCEHPAAPRARPSPASPGQPARSAPPPGPPASAARSPIVDATPGASAGAAPTAAASPDFTNRPMMRGGPRWGSERPRFHVARPTGAAGQAPAPTVAGPGAP